MKKPPQRRGFTLLEILIVIGMIAILAAVVLVAINPLRQFALARNSQRISNVNEIMNAIASRTVDQKGIFAEGTGSCKPVPSVPTLISLSSYNIRPCLVPDYISELPMDPNDSSNTCTSAECSGSGEGYDTKYTIVQDETTHRITVCAPEAAESAIDGAQAYCVTR